MNEAKRKNNAKKKFYVSIPRINGEDPLISAFCLIDYEKSFVVMKVYKKNEAKLIRENLERVWNGTYDMRYEDSLKKRLYLDHLSTKDLVEKTTVKSLWFINTFFYEARWHHKNIIYLFESHNLMRFFYIVINT